MLCLQGGAPGDWNGLSGLSSLSSELLPREVVSPSLRPGPQELGTLITFYQVSSRVSISLLLEGDGSEICSPDLQCPSWVTLGSKRNLSGLHFLHL
jgi:hypothetical protein